MAYIRGIGFALDDVEDGDVAALLAWICRNHPILRLQQPSHNIQDSSFSNSLCLFDVVASERRIGGQQEMAAWCRDERSYYADKIVVHVAGIAECSRAGRHYGR